MITIKCSGCNDTADLDLDRFDDELVELGWLYLTLTDSYLCQECLRAYD